MKSNKVSRITGKANKRKLSIPLFKDIDKYMTLTNREIMRETICNYVKTVGLAYEAITEVKSHKLGPYGMKGIRAEFLKLSMPEWVLYAYYDNKPEKYQDGWCLCSRENCADPAHSKLINDYFDNME